MCGGASVRRCGVQQDGGAGARYFSPSPRAGGCAWPSFVASALPIYTNRTIQQKYAELYLFCVFRRLSGLPAAPATRYPRFFQGFYISRIIQFVLFLQNISNCILFIPCRRTARRRAADGLPPSAMRAAHSAQGGVRFVANNKHAPPARRRKTHGLPQMATRAARSERATRAARKKECIR